MITAEASRALLPTYDRIRAVGRGLNDAIVVTLSKQAVNEAARSLGLLERGKIVFPEVVAADRLADYAIYDVRTGGKSAVERFAPRVAADVDSQMVFAAMRAFRFTMVQVTEGLDNVGIVANDLLYGGRVVILDRGLGESAFPTVVLVTRLLAFDRWSMTSGIALHIDEELAAMFLSGLGDISFLATAPRPLLAKLTANMITLAVGDPEQTKAEWRRAMARRG